MSPENNVVVQDVQSPDVNLVETTTCCIVGGGPAGAILALLLARQGIPVTLLEAHLDFDRDFRGDTIHPAVMEILDEIGLAERLLELRHTEVHRAGTLTEGGSIGIEFSRLRTKFPYIMVIAQSRFLEFITEEAKRYPSFRLIMGARVDELIEENGTVRGIRYRKSGATYELHAALTVGADGRFSIMRKLGGFETVTTSSPIDVLWFRISRQEDDRMENLEGRFGSGFMIVLINRFDYWQVGYTIPKNGYQNVRAAGLEAFRQSLAKAVPEITDRLSQLTDWKQIAVLSVEANRVKRWYKSGLLLIGDAAHVMSPAGGVGINYAIQDAVVASNILSSRLKAGLPIAVDDLAKIQHERELPTRFIQTIQSLMQNAALMRIKNTNRDNGVSTPPRWVSVILKLPLVRSLPAQIIGFGLRPPHVKESQRSGATT